MPQQYYYMRRAPAMRIQSTVYTAVTDVVYGPKSVKDIVSDFRLLNCSICLVVYCFCGSLFIGVSVRVVHKTS